MVTKIPARSGRKPDTKEMDEIYSEEIADSVAQELADDLASRSVSPLDAAERLVLLDVCRSNESLIVHLANLVITMQELGMVKNYALDFEIDNARIIFSVIKKDKAAKKDKTKY